MLIVSQDGKQIFNFDRVTNTWIDTDVLDSKGEVFEICADGETLGYYKTEERAKEVFEEIIKRKSLFEITKVLGGLDARRFMDKYYYYEFDIYKMPKG
ncbi:MAG: hypothetical protein J6D03_02825 [Clostridia bacterium]|nr:hypothetical protein [Clostridia bacterium]